MIVFKNIAIACCIGLIITLVIIGLFDYRLQLSANAKWVDLIFLIFIVVTTSTVVPFIILCDNSKQKMRYEIEINIYAVYPGAKIYVTDSDKKFIIKSSEGEVYEVLFHNLTNYKITEINKLNEFFYKKI